MTRTNNTLKVVVDTNVLLVSILPKFKYHIIMQALYDGVYELCISNEILTEYNEKLAERYATALCDVLISALMNLPNVSFYDPTYKWRLIHADPDDDKFVDCAIASNADFIVTSDKHYDVLKQIPFPEIAVLSVDEFIELLTHQV
jgi:uncharacterized protein